MVAKVPLRMVDRAPSPILDSGRSASVTGLTSTEPVISGRVGKHRRENCMSVFGSVPGMTILTMASVLLLGATFLGAAIYVTHSGEAQRAWKAVLLPVIFMFVLTDLFALSAAIVENHFVTRITGN
jgi:hypothetical protein